MGPVDVAGCDGLRRPLSCKVWSYRICGRAHRIWNARHRSFAGWGPRGNGPVARRRSVAGDPHWRSAARGGRTTSALPPESGHLQCN